MLTRAALLTSLVLLPGCARDDGPERASQAFAAFQRALRSHDEAACSELLTRASRAALASIPWEEVASQRPLQVVGARRMADNRNEFYVDVVDPNQRDERGRYVVVQEYGRLRVDLIASAGLTARTVEASSSREEFVPTELTPADYDRIRAYELSQPPANPGGN